MYVFLMHIYLHVCTNHTLCRDRGGVWGPFGPVPARNIEGGGGGGGCIVCF